MTKYVHGHRDYYHDESDSKIQSIFFEEYTRCFGIVGKDGTNMAYHKGKYHENKVFYYPKATIRHGFHHQQYFTMRIFVHEKEIQSSAQYKLQVKEYRC